MYVAITYGNSLLAGPIPCLKPRSLTLHQPSTVLQSLACSHITSALVSNFRNVNQHSELQLGCFYKPWGGVALFMKLPERFGGVVVVRPGLFLSISMLYLQATFIGCTCVPQHGW